MEVLVFSDSHGEMREMRNIIDQKRPSAIIHLGDCVVDAEALSRRYPNLTVYRIRGNNDYDNKVPFHAVVRPDGLPILITHGHRERVSAPSFGTLSYLVQQEGCSIGLFGHTHCAALSFENGLLLCNPGSISLPRDGVEGYAMLSIEQGQLRSVKLCSAEGRVRKQLAL